MKLTTVRPGLVFCVPHLLEREPLYHYDGCTACEQAKTAGQGKAEAPSVRPGTPGRRLATLGELAGRARSTSSAEPREGPTPPPARPPNPTSACTPGRRR